MKFVEEIKTHKKSHYLKLNSIRSQTINDPMTEPQAHNSHMQACLNHIITRETKWDCEENKTKKEDFKARKNQPFRSLLNPA